MTENFISEKPGRSKKKTPDGIIVLGINEVADRYSVGINQAIEIIKQIKWFVGNGGALGKGRVLRTECEAWEEWKGQQRNPKILAQMEKAKQTGGTE